MSDLKLDYMTISKSTIEDRDVFIECDDCKTGSFVRVETLRQWLNEVAPEKEQCQSCIEKSAKIDKQRNLLEDVINELDLSEAAIEKHGPLGTEPAKLVRLVLDEKDLRIRALKQGFVEITNKELSARELLEKELSVRDFFEWLLKNNKFEWFYDQIYYSVDDMIAKVKKEIISKAVKDVM